MNITGGNNRFIDAPNLGSKARSGVKVHLSIIGYVALIQGGNINHSVEKSCIYTKCLLNFLL